MEPVVERTAPERVPPRMIEARGADGSAGGLEALDRDAVIDAFRAHGWVVLRGFDVDPPAYDAFARRFTASHFIGYGRVPFPGLPAITMGNEALLPLAPHADNAIRAEELRPEITWFWCEVPADEGGETTFFDGLRVWSALSPATREALQAQRVRYQTRNAWKQMRFADTAAFERHIASQGGRVTAFHDDVAEIEFVAPAARRARWCEGLAFTSSLALAGTPGFDGLRVSLEGEAGFPEAIRRDVEQALDACCEPHAWRAGDIVMLDNTRCVHGRRAYRDARRRLYLIQTLRASF
jgi:alpha-ketoglutarate-dependent taurine dioxygenase